MYTVIYLYEDDTPPAYKEIKTMEGVIEFTRTKDTAEFMVVEGRLLKSFDQKNKNWQRLLRNE